MERSKSWLRIENVDYIGSREEVKYYRQVTVATPQKRLHQPRLMQCLITCIRITALELVQLFMIREFVCLLPQRKKCVLFILHELIWQQCVCACVQVIVLCI